MALSIFEPTVSKVAHGLAGKVILIYGTNNTGKTFQTVRAEKPFVFACESGLNAQSNVKHHKILKWGDFTRLVKEFTDPKTIDEAKEMYSTIIIDEVYASSLMCQKFVCDTYGEGCISLGSYDGDSRVNLYQIYERLYWEQIQKLSNSGYTVIFIGHMEEKDGFIRPKGDKRCINPILDNSDIVAYLNPNGVSEDGHVIKSSAYFAQTDKFFARSRYDYMDTMIDEFTIENLNKAIAEGIEREEKVTGVQSVSFDEQQAEYRKEAAEAPTFEELQKDLAEWGNKLGQQYPDELTECVESVLGGGKKVSACTPKQTEAMAMVLDNIKSKCLELGVK